MHFVHLMMKHQIKNLNQYHRMFLLVYLFFLTVILDYKQNLQLLINVFSKNVFFVFYQKDCFCYIS